MIKITSNLGQVTGLLHAKLVNATAPNGILKDKMVRAVASSIGGDIKIRVHQDGIKSDGTPIGNYSSAYLKRRQGKKYNRTSDSKIILSLTRQQENDFGIVAAEPLKTSTGYGLGFKNSAIYSPSIGKTVTEASLRKSLNKKTKKGNSSIRLISNAQKAAWQKEKYGDIYKPTQQEEIKIKVLYESFADEFIRDLNS